jgi:hypothetical protein
VAWALAAFMPLAVISSPILAIRIGFVFLVCAMYLWPVTWVSTLFGLPIIERRYFEWPFLLIGAVYCAAIGALIAWLLSKLFRVTGLITGRRAIVLAGIVWIPFGLFVTYQVLHYKGVFARSRPCPGHLYALQRHCTGISDLKEYMLEGFIDASYLATFRAQPGVLQAFAAENRIQEADPATMPDELWKQPPVWWATSRDKADRVYVTPGFSFNQREGDGDFYLLIEDRDTGEVFVLLHANF